jgi:hypothetical protein
MNLSFDRRDLTFARTEDAFVRFFSEKKVVNPFRIGIFVQKLTLMDAKYRIICMAMYLLTGIGCTPFQLRFLPDETRRNEVLQSFETKKPSFDGTSGRIAPVLRGYTAGPGRQMLKIIHKQ